VKSTASHLLSFLGLIAACSLFSGALLLGSYRDRGSHSARSGDLDAHPGTVRFLAVGDINLGRAVGQEILQGDTLYPFRFVQETFRRYDVVFGNLECQLSDQQGETQHPRNNLVFTGPPGGAYSLKMAGVTMVSTANNHALDYGVRAHAETISNLTAAGVRFCGTAEREDVLFEPLLFDRKGIRFALFACTDVMNIDDTTWRQYVAPADTALLFPRIREFRTSVDFVIVSYHGGGEYSDHPTEGTKSFARSSLKAGADLFLGHHPHVPQGIEEVDGRFIVYSLGNFVFRQPFQFWTQRSYAFAADITRLDGRTVVHRFRCIPIAAGLQPAILSGQSERDTILARVRTLSRLNDEQVAWFE